jgi:hypothetical protein
MRRHAVRLDQGFSPSGRKQVDVPEAYILDDQPTGTNRIGFGFELQRRPGVCGPGQPQGAAADLAYRKENRVHHLRSRIFRYFEEPVLAGREAKLFVDNETPDAEAAYAVAKRNLHELFTLGREVERLQGSTGFDELRQEFGKLIAMLRNRRLAFTFVEKDGESSRRVSVTAPALASDPEWKGLVPDAVIEPIPESWQLP